MPAVDVHSLGFVTELELLRRAGSRVEDRGDHLVVHTPDNPTYHWGNFLLLPSAPAADEIGSWVETFRRELPGLGHVALGVDRPDVGALDPLRAAGWHVDVPVAMTAREVQGPAHPHPGATLRPLADDADWEQQVALSQAGEDDARLTTEFLTRRHQSYRELAETGAGRWWGAFLDGRLVASLGLYLAGRGLARYQNVKTHPDHRGRGLAGGLVHEAGRDALDRLGARQLVMVADPAEAAIRGYRRAGFVEGDHHAEATLLPTGEKRDVGQAAG